MRERNLQVVQAASAEDQPIENCWAFLVGVNDYSDSDYFPHLNFCRNDVTALRDLLEQVGYTVTCLHDGLSYGDRLFPSHRKIRERLKTLCEDVGPNDLLWVYFACHGTRQGDKKPRLVAADTHSDDLNSFISVAEVEDVMRSSGSKRLVLMLDACHIGVGTDTRSAVLSDPEFIHNVYELATGFALIAASTDQQPAVEQNGHGVFSHYVLSALREAKLSDTDPNQNFVTVGSLQRYVLHRLKEWRNQHGYEQKPQGRADGDLGEMILVDYRKYSIPDVPEPEQTTSTINIASTDGRGRSSSHNSVKQVQLRAKEKTYENLVKKYTALEDQINNTRDADDKIALQDKQAQIEREMEEVAQVIQRLKNQ
jgi:uncharacterized caspase-like protein